MDPIKHASEKFPHQRIYIAYEPLESIGTGIAATSDSITQVIHKIHEQLAATDDCKILYGGSVTPEHVKSLKAIDALDGFLIGSASANGNRFAAIITA
jgi:triosephosphate isomerase